MKKYQIIDIDIFDPGLTTIQFSEGNDVSQAMENAFGSDWRELFPDYEIANDMLTHAEECSTLIVVELGREVK